MDTPGLLDPPQAWEFMQQRPEAILVDVRSTIEYLYVGHPANAIHLPWQEPPEWTVQADFSDRLRTLLGERGYKPEQIEQTPLLMICRSGARSHAAAELLLRHGFHEVYNVTEGFEGVLDGRKHRGNINGWRFHNLPWEQS